jgi:hypothetical protein
MVAKIGTVNCSVVASASGSSSTAPKVKTMPVRPIAVRVTCAPNRFVRIEPRPGPIMIQAVTTGTAQSWRWNIVSTRLAPRVSASLISADIVDRHRIATRRNAKPLKTLSVLAGTTRVRLGGGAAPHNPALPLIHLGGTRRRDARPP